MAQFLVTTTGLVSEVVFDDLGARTLTHPTVDIDLLLEFTFDELINSEDIQSAIDAGEITVKNEFGENITNVSAQASQVVVSGGTNINITGTNSNPVVNTDDNVNFTSVSASTIVSGNTNLETIITTLAVGSEDITRVQPGVNMTTGGTNNFPVVNLDNDIVINSLSASTISGNTLYSAGTNVEVIIDDKISDALSAFTTTQFDAFDAVGGTVTTSSSWGVATVPLSVQRQIVTAFTHSTTVNNDEVTVNESDLYLVLGRTSIESSGSNSRTQSECRLERDTGSGFGEVSGTTAEMYQRQNNYGATGSFFAIMNLSSGDKLRMSFRRVVGTAGVELQPSGSALAIMKVGLSSNGSLPAFTEHSVIFAGPGGVLTDNNTDFCWDNSDRRLKLSGDSTETVLSIGGETDTGNANLYVETNDPGSDIEAFRIYYNRGAGISGWLSSFYDGATPTLRLTDEDDDSPYITFNVIGSGTYASPEFVNSFGGRGPVAGATTGFSWKVNGTEKAILDDDMDLVDDGDYRRNGNLYMTGVWASATNSVSVTNLYQRRQNGTPTDLSPYVAPFDMTIVAVTTSSNSSQTWDAEVRSAPAGSTTFSTIHTLSVSSALQGTSNGLSIDVDAGERIATFIAGTGINYPNIDIYWKSR